MHISNRSQSTHDARVRSFDRSSGGQSEVRPLSRIFEVIASESKSKYELKSHLVRNEEHKTPHMKKNDLDEDFKKGSYNRMNTRC